MDGVVRSLANSGSGIQAGYDKETQELTVVFPSGSYTYSGVPPDVYEGLLKAPSAGKYFNQRIRDVY